MPDIHSAEPADQIAFRKLMGLFATGVCVVSFRKKGDGERDISAMTINSLVSVSLDPMLVSWSLQNSASQYADYAEAEEFAISILGADQQALARRYAARADSALSPADFIHSERGMPVIKDALAVIECRRWASYPAGDHTMILGEVQAMNSVDPATHPRALGFYNGHFSAIGG